MSTQSTTLAGRIGCWIDTESDGTIRRSLGKLERRPGFGLLELPTCVIRYRAHGAGPRTFVFAADPPVVLEHYDALVEVLREQGRVIVFELPGFGFSPARRGFDFTMDAGVAVVGSLLDHLRVRGATLCFPCVSAHVATALAHARPELVGALVLSQAPSFRGSIAWKESRDTRGVLARPALGQIFMRALKRKRAPWWLSLAVGDPTRLAPIQGLAEEKLREGSRWSLASAFQQLLVEASEPPPVTQPIVALWGTEDGSHRATDRSTSYRLGHDVRLIEWDDVGHFPEIEAPRRFAGLLAGLAP